MKTSFALTEEMKQEFKWKDAETFEGGRKGQEREITTSIGFFTFGKKLQV